MLLIGSRAAQYHFQNFRKPKDYDLIIDPFDMQWFELNPNAQLISDKGNKKRYKILGEIFEVEIAKPSKSSEMILNYEGYKGPHLSLPGLEEQVQVASPETLLAIKKSHVCFNIHWRKNFLDYSFLKRNVKDIALNKKVNAFYKKRFDETRARLSHREINFNVDNELFFKKSEKLVKRFVPHDDIHLAVKFYQRPLFESIKEDLNKAAISLPLFLALPYEKQLKTIAEETMVLAIERFILPKAMARDDYSETEAMIKTAARMCHHYLPVEFRMFAVDNFYKILDVIPEDFSKTIVERVLKENP